MLRPSHWGLVADDPQRAIAFYTNIFGWQFQKWEGPVDYWMFSTGTEGPGIDGGIGPHAMPGDKSCNVIDVPDIDEYIAKVKANGGTEWSPKGAVPGIGWTAYFHDTEGNPFGIIQFDPTAA